MNNNDNKYVYIYLDPRKPGIFVYDEFTFEYEPFYVGKGSGYRCNAHLSREGGNKYRFSKIKNIINSGLKPVIIKLITNINNDVASEIETKLIKLIGRKPGPLTNLTDGGDGGHGNTGHSWTTTQRDKIMSIRKIKAPMSGKSHSVETKIKQSAAAMGREFTVEHRDNLSKQKNKKIEGVQDDIVIVTYNSIKEMIKILNLPYSTYKKIGKMPIDNIMYRYA